MKLLKINPADSVAVALEAIVKGEVITLGKTQLEILQDVSPGHKVALEAIDKDGIVLKYGNPIGRATRDIATARLKFQQRKTVPHEQVFKNLI